MPRLAPLLALSLAVLSGACMRPGRPTPVGLVVALPETNTLSDDWHQAATPAGRDRLARLSEAWTTGLAAARRSVRAEPLAALLLTPGSAQPRAAPPPGVYRCRVVRLGDGTHARDTFIAFPAAYCYVKAEAALLTFTKGTGSERPGGRLYGDGDARMVFLGSLATGTEKLPPPYGARPDRDRIGVIERIGDFRWRLALPFPSPGVALQLIELTPDPAGLIPPQ